MIDSAAGFDGVDEAVYFVQALGEEAEGDHRRDELQHTGQTKQNSVEGCVSQTGGDEAREQTSGLLFAVRRVGWTIERFLITRHCLLQRVS